MEDLISRQAAIDALGEAPEVWTDSPEEFAALNQWEMDVTAIEAVPSADRPSGQWVELGQNKDGTHSICCGACGVGKYKSKGHARSRYTRDKYRYCPHCGADMRGEEE